MDNPFRYVHGAEFKAIFFYLEEGNFGQIFFFWTSWWVKNPIGYDIDIIISLIKRFIKEESRTLQRADHKIVWSVSRLNDKLSELHVGYWNQLWRTEGRPNFWEPILYPFQNTVCTGSSDHPEKYISYLHLKMRFTPFLTIAILRLNIIRLQSKIILGHLNSIG